MNRRRSTASTALGLSARTLEMSIAVPQVVAERVGRMLSAGPLPSARDRDEFSRMGSEKLQAFQQSWSAMGVATWTQLLEAQMAAWQSLWRLPPLHPLAAASHAQHAMQQPARMFTEVLDAGLRPVHAKAVGNARRLAREHRTRG